MSGRAGTWSHPTPCNGRLAGGSSLEPVRLHDPGKRTERTRTALPQVLIQSKLEDSLHSGKRSAPRRTRTYNPLIKRPCRRSVRETLLPKVHKQFIRFSFRCKPFQPVKKTRSKRGKRRVLRKIPQLRQRTVTC